MTPSPALSRRAPVLKPDFTVHQGAAVSYRRMILNRDGSVARPWSAWKKNLILDAGLNKIGNATRWATAFAYACIGTGTPVLRRDSGAITLTRAGNTVTASAGFFAGTDVSWLLKFDSGEEMYVTGYTDPQNVTVSVAGALGASPGTLWHVNLTGLVAEHARTATYTQAGGDNGTTFVGDTYTFHRTFLFAAEAGPVTVTEIGWSPNAGAGANLFGMDLIPGVGDTLLAGQQYKVEVMLTVKLAPSAAAAVGDVGNNGFVTAGDHMVVSVGPNPFSEGMTVVNADGSESDHNSTYLLCPGSTTGGGACPACYLITLNTFTLPGAIQTAYVNPARTVSDVAASWVAYVNGNFYRDLTAQWSVAAGNGNVYGLGQGSGSTLIWALKFTGVQVKDNTHKVTIVVRVSWGRILTN